MLYSPSIDDHMKTIGIDQSLWNRSSFEHKFLNNTKKIYQHAGKWDDQQKLKDILDADMVLIPEGVTYDSPNLHMTSTPFKKPSARKSLCLFTKILNVKKKTAKRRVGAAKSKPRAMEVGNICGPIKQNKKGLQKSMIRSNVIFMNW